MNTILRYDGKYAWFPGENRSWTILSHFIDAKGYDRYRGSFGLNSLIEMGIVRHV